MRGFDVARKRIRECLDSGSESLDLSGLDFDFFPEEIRELTGITALNIIRNLQLRSLDGIEGLEQLTTLEASRCKNLREFGSLQNLKNLTELNISSNPHLKNLEDLKGLKQLTTLTALNCKNLRDIKALEELPKLSSISLENCHIEKFPRFLLSAKYLALSRNPLNDFPVELLPESRFDNCLPAARNYFEECEKGLTKNTLRKWLFLGNGRTGKTSIIRILNGEEPRKDEETTHGIKIVGMKIDKTDYNFWDFGGQDLYLATHQIFMRSADGIILCYRRGEHETGTQDDGLGYFWENRTLSYWAEMIRNNAPNATVLPIEINPDKDGERENQDPWDKAKQRMKGANVLDKITVGNVFENCSEINSAKERISTAIKFSRKEKYPLPSSWVKAIKTVMKKRKEKKLISQEKYRNFTQDMAGETLLQYLHGSGELFYDSRLFEGSIVLDQQWLLNSIYALFDRKTWIKIIRAHDGKFYASSSKDVWPNNSEEERKLFISMMESCAVLFELTDSDSSWEDKIFLIPELSRSENAGWNNLFKQHKGKVWEMEYKMPFLHRGVLSAWLAHAGSVWKDAVYYFRNGLGLYWAGSPLSVEFKLHEGEYGEEGRICIRFKDDEKFTFREFLEPLLGNLEGYLEEAGIRNFTRPTLPWHMERKERDEGEKENQLLAIEESDRKRKLFVAFSKEQGDILDKVIKHMTASQYSPKRPPFDFFCDKEIKKGEKWDKRITSEIKQADGILFLLSSDYLTNDYCQKEIKLAIEQKKKNPEYQIYPFPLDECIWEDFFGDLQGCIYKDNTKPMYMEEDRAGRDKLLLEQVRDILDLFLGEPNAGEQKSM